MRLKFLNNSQVYTPAKANQTKVMFYNKNSINNPTKKATQRMLSLTNNSGVTSEKNPTSKSSSISSQAPRHLPIKLHNTKNILPLPIHIKSMDLTGDSENDMKNLSSRRIESYRASQNSEGKSIKSFSSAQRSLTNILEFNKMSLLQSPRKDDKTKISKLMRDKSLSFLMNNSSMHKKSNDFLTPTNSIPHLEMHKRSSTTFTGNNNLNNSFLTSSSSTTKITVNIFPINLQDVISLQEKIKEILIRLTNSEPPFNECIEWWNFFSNCALLKNYSDLFTVKKNKTQVITFCHIESLCYLLCIDLCTNSEAFTKVNIILRTIFSLIHFDFLLMAKFILIKYNSSDDLSDKLYALLKTELSDNLNSKEINEYLITELTKHNIKQIMNYYEKIIDMFYMQNKRVPNKYNKNYNKSYSDKKEIDFNSRSSITSFFVDSFYNLSTFSSDCYGRIMAYFKENFVQLKNNHTVVRATVNKINDSTQSTNNYKRKHIATKSLPSNLQIKKIVVQKMLNPKYLLPEISPNYIYTLILDLENTLVYVKFEEDGNFGKAKLIFRPFLFDFLKKMKNLYEIVLFTLNSKGCILPIINEIEKNDTYFIYKLYRENAEKVNGFYVKDLSKLGRDLSRTIIIDNLEDNYKFQRENGICIKAFYGDRLNDGCTLYELGSVLEKIRFDECDDVRESIINYKKRILKKVTN